MAMNPWIWLGIASLVTAGATHAAQLPRPSIPTLAARYREMVWHVLKPHGLDAKIDERHRVALEAMRAQATPFTLPESPLPAHEMLRGALAQFARYAREQGYDRKELEPALLATLSDGQQEQAKAEIQREEGQSRTLLRNLETEIHPEFKTAMASPPGVATRAWTHDAWDRIFSVYPDNFDDMSGAAFALYDDKTGTDVGMGPLHRFNPATLAFAADNGDPIYVSLRQRALMRLDPLTGKERKILDLAKSIGRRQRATADGEHAFALSGNGALAAVSSFGDRKLRGREPA
jgi:hypothetical protein